MVNDVFRALKDKADESRRKKSINSAQMYDKTINSLMRYWLTLDLKGPLNFSMIDVQFLEGYEAWMMQVGASTRDGGYGPASVTTIGMYIARIKVVVNIAIEEEIIKKSPFARGKYKIHYESGKRRPITLAQVHKIMDYRTEDKIKMRSRDFWLFSYLCNGINFKDILNLKWKNLNFQKKTFSFVREKTKNTVVVRKEINGILFDECVWIIHRWGNRSSFSTGPESYVFPFFGNGWGEAKKHNRLTSFIAMTNKKMKEIGEELGIDADLRTYVARHTFANVMMQSEVPVSFISQAMGHANITTTHSYLGRFSEEKSSGYLRKLLSNKEPDMSKYPQLVFED